MTPKLTLHLPHAPLYMHPYMYLNNYLHVKLHNIQPTHFKIKNPAYLFHQIKKKNYPSALQSCLATHVANKNNTVLLFSGTSASSMVRRTHTALPESPSFIPSNRIRQLKTTGNSSYRWNQILLDSEHLGICTDMHIPPTHTHIIFKNPIQNKKSRGHKSKKRKYDFQTQVWQYMHMKESIRERLKWSKHKKLT